MFGTYQRLHVPVWASAREVLRAARRKLKKGYRTGRKHRVERHKFYREMLKHHAHERKLYNAVMNGR